MSIDKITEFKSSILDEVYRHQGFLTSVSNTIDSYDETKKQQVAQLITEQQRKINKSLGLIYAFFRTIGSFDELENQIKQLVGDDLADAFIMNDVGDYTTVDTSVNVADGVEVTQDFVQPGEQSASEQLFESSVDPVVPSEGVLVEPETTVTDAGAITDDQGAIQEDVSTNDFVLSPIEEGVAAHVPVDVNSGVTGASLENNQTEAEEVQNVSSSVGEGVSETGFKNGQQVDNVSSTSGAGIKSFIRSGQGQVRAILVTPGQIGKLSGSREKQKSLLAGAGNTQDVVNNISTQNDQTNVQLQVQTLMNQASQAYAAGKAEEAQMYMNQVSELNKSLQQNQSVQADGGVALVKKGI